MRVYCLEHLLHPVINFFLIQRHPLEMVKKKESRLPGTLITLEVILLFSAAAFLGCCFFSCFFRSCFLCCFSRSCFLCCFSRSCFFSGAFFCCCHVFEF